MQIGSKQSKWKMACSIVLAYTLILGGGLTALPTTSRADEESSHHENATYFAYATEAKGKLDSFYNEIQNLKDPVKDLDVFGVIGWQWVSTNRSGTKEKEVFNLDEVQKQPYYMGPRVEDASLARRTFIDKKAPILDQQWAGELPKGFRMTGDVRFSLTPEKYLRIDFPQYPKAGYLVNKNHKYLALAEDALGAYLIPEQPLIMSKLAYRDEAEKYIDAVYYIPKIEAAQGLGRMGFVLRAPVPIHMENAIPRQEALLGMTVTPSDLGLSSILKIGNHSLEITNQTVRDHIFITKMMIAFQVAATTGNAQALSVMRDLTYLMIANSRKMQAHMKNALTAAEALETRRQAEIKQLETELGIDSKNIAQQFSAVKSKLGTKLSQQENFEKGLWTALRQTENPYVTSFDGSQKLSGFKGTKNALFLEPHFEHMEDKLAEMESKINEYHGTPINRKEWKDRLDKTNQLDLAALYDSITVDGVETNTAITFAARLKQSLQNIKLKPVFEAAAGFSILLAIWGGAAAFFYFKVYQGQLGGANGVGLANFFTIWTSRTFLTDIAFLFGGYLGSLGILNMILNAAYGHKQIVLSTHGLRRGLFDTFELFTSWIQRLDVFFRELATPGPQRMARAVEGFKHPFYSRTWQRIDTTQRGKPSADEWSKIQEFDKELQSKIIALENERLEQKRSLASHLTEEESAEIIRSIDRTILQIHKLRTQIYEPALSGTRLSKTAWQYIYYRMKQDSQDGKLDLDNPFETTAILNHLLVPDTKMRFAIDDNRAIQIASYFRSLDVREALGEKIPQIGYSQLSTEEQAHIEKSFAAARDEAKKFSPFRARLKQLFFPVLPRFFPASGLAATVYVIYNVLMDEGLGVLTETTNRAQYEFGAEKSIVDGNMHLAADAKIEVAFQLGIISLVLTAFLEQASRKSTSYELNRTSNLYSGGFTPVTFLRNLRYTFADSATLFTEGGRKLYWQVWSYTFKMIPLRIALLTILNTVLWVSSGFDPSLAPNLAFMVLYLFITGPLFTFTNKFFINPMTDALVAALNIQKDLKWWLNLSFLSLAGFLTAYIGSQSKVFFLSTVGSPSFLSPDQIMHNIRHFFGHNLWGNQLYGDLTILALLAYGTYPMWYALKNKIFSKKKIPTVSCAR